MAPLNEMNPMAILVVVFLQLCSPYTIGFCGCEEERGSQSCPNPTNVWWGMSWVDWFGPHGLKMSSRCTNQGRGGWWKGGFHTSHGLVFFLNEALRSASIRPFNNWVFVRTPQISGVFTWLAFCLAFHNWGTGLLILLTILSIIYIFLLSNFSCMMEWDPPITLSIRINEVS